MDGRPGRAVRFCLRHGGGAPRSSDSYFLPGSGNHRGEKRPRPVRRQAEALTRTEGRSPLHVGARCVACDVSVPKTVKSTCPPQNGRERPGNLKTDQVFFSQCRSVRHCWRPAPIASNVPRKPVTTPGRQRPNRHTLLKVVYASLWAASFENDLIRVAGFPSNPTHQKAPGLI